MITPQALGFEFERRVHYFLQKIRQKVYTETDIKQKYSISGIDHMIRTNTITLCFQCKWQSKKISVSQTSYFIQCVNKMSRLVGQRCIGIFVSNQDFSPQSYKDISDENFRNENEFSGIYHEDIKKIKNRLMDLLYELKVFMYDEDGSTIMRIH